MKSEMAYKVWISVEALDTETDDSENIPLQGFAETASFETPDEAIDFAVRLHGIGININEIEDTVIEAIECAQKLRKNLG